MLLDFRVHNHSKQSHDTRSQSVREHRQDTLDVRACADVFHFVWLVFVHV